MQLIKIIFRLISLRILPLLPVIVISFSNTWSQEKKVSSLEEVTKSGRDLWGEEAMAQPNGASYEFFRDLLTPPRYVNADFRYYPIVLSAANSKIKARLISNGSGINIRGGVKAWRDVGVPFTFRVGPDEFLFGSYPERLSEPVLAEGWLPIPEICYSHKTPFQSEGMVPLNQVRNDTPAEIYRLEAFAATDSLLSLNGIVLVKFDLKQGTDGYIAVEAGMDSTWLINGKLIDEKGNTLALFDNTWKKEGRLIKARLKTGMASTMAIATKPLTSQSDFTLKNNTYTETRDACVRMWKEKLAEGMQIMTPEPLVNNAYRNSLCQIFQLVNEDKIYYSSGNQYEKMYESEGSDAVHALSIYGFERDTRKYMPPLFEFTRKGLELHHASFKINNLCQYYWQTRDKSVVEEFRPRWEKEAKLLDKGRVGPEGLYPEEQYCGDIHTYVQSLNVNSQAWRAMRDLGAVLAETGKKDEADHYTKEASIFRKVVLKAIDKNVNLEIRPPFVPIALSGGEPVHDPILHTRIGSYWNIIIGYSIQSGIFPAGTEQAGWIPKYQEQHGGILMGMIRSGGGQFNFWTSDQRINPLYGTRYSLNTLQRDDPDRALVSFYGMLAQGLTRNTFIGGEGSSLQPIDKYGRTFYCPPNSAASAHLLSMLRNLLVQDWDLDDDGKPETLRLGFATPPRWLEDGKKIKIANAPTAFGKISYSIQSDLKKGRVEMRFSPPALAPDKIQIRIRVPEGWQIKSVSSGSREFEADQYGTVEVTVKDPAVITFQVRETRLK